MVYRFDGSSVAWNSSRSYVEKQDLIGSRTPIGVGRVRRPVGKDDGLGVLPGGVDDGDRGSRGSAAVDLRVRVPRHLERDGAPIGGPARIVQGRLRWCREHNPPIAASDVLDFDGGSLETAR